MVSSVQANEQTLLPTLLLEKARSLFPHTKTGKIYLNHASSAPMSTRVIDAITKHLHERSVGMIDTYLAYDVSKIEECRNHVRTLIHAGSTDRIALLTNTSEPLNIIASGLTWKTGDRLLLHEAEFPANVWPYLNLRRHGVEIDVMPQEKGHPSVQLIAESITDRTKLVALSAVQFLTGHRADLKAIGSLCRERNIIFAVDGIQAVGAVRIDVQEMKIDALAAGCQKWQLGPQGTSWLYLTEELQSKIQPAHLGWLAVAEPWNFFDYNQGLAPTARRYEGGTKNIPGIWGMEAALRIFQEFTPEAIEGHILFLAQMLISGLSVIDGVKVITPVDSGQHAGIVTIELPKTVNDHAVFEKLTRKQVAISLREGKLRYSPHFYNSESEIEFAISATQGAIRA